MKFSWRFALPLLLFCIFIGMSGLALYQTINGQRDLQQLPSVLLNKPAPKTTMPQLGAVGRNFSIADYRGEAILVNFFASWCLPCRVEAQVLDRLADERVSIVGITYKDREIDTQKFLDTYGNPFVAIGVDRDGQIGLQWGTYGVPETFLVDANGLIQWRHAGILTQGMIASTILPLLEQ